jgi:hypothetical protein
LAVKQTAGGRPTPFPATTRWLRGQILDRLRDAAEGSWTSFDESIGAHDQSSVRAAIAALEREGMLEQHPVVGGFVRLALT